MSKTIVAYYKEEPYSVIVDESFVCPGSIHVNYKGYAMIHQSGKNKRLHRIIAKAKVGEVVDHINGNKLDNRLCNLRVTNSRGNAMNRRAKGYYKIKQTGKFHAQIKVGDRRISIGHYSTEEEARQAYVTAHAKYFREFSPYYKGGN